MSESLGSGSPDCRSSLVVFQDWSGFDVCIAGFVGLVIGINVGYFIF